MAAAEPDLRETVVTAQKRAVEAGLKPEDMQLPLQPPLQTLTNQVCVVFALS